METDSKQTRARMRGRRRVLKASGAAVLIAGAAAAAVWGVTARSLPDYGGRHEVGGLAAPAEIRRDAHAVPHVFAADDAGVFFGLGYAHAQDRLWQMDILRRTAQGRLSERFGAQTLGTDEFLRRLDLAGAARSSLEVQPPEAMAALEAYAAGVNAWIDRTGGRGGAAPEFLLFGPAAEPWAPEDSLAILKLVALQLASHADREVRRARASMILPTARLHDILPDDPGAPHADGPAYRELFPGLPAAAVPDVALPGLSGDGAASNAWAVSGSRSTTGMPQMANDPHLDLTAPGIWYLARLSLAAGDVIGATIPGIPAVLSGRTARTAWGITAANVDDQDVVIERIDPEHPGRVLGPDGSIPMAERAETIAVRGGDAQQIALRWTPNGPVIPGKYHDLAAVTPPGHVAVLSRTLFDPEDTSLAAAIELMRAGSLPEMLEAGEGFSAPAINLTAIDRAHIALQVLGALPARDPGHPTLGRMPAPGTDPRTAWQGVLPYSANPRLYDPPGGTVGNTNNRTATRPFPRHVSFDWGDTERILRLRELLDARVLHSPADMAAMQADTASMPARRLVPLLLAHAGPAEGHAAEALRMLGNWDGRMEADRPEPLIHAAWTRALQRRLAAGLGPLADELTRVNPVFLTRVLEDAGGASAWCGGDCGPAVRAALDEALEALEDEPAALRWGDAHRAEHRHPVLGGMPSFGWLVNIRHPSGGGDDTLMRGLTRGTGDRPFDNVHASGYRGLYDMADPDSSRFVLATGQSGHPLSRHYRDQNRLWREGRYLPMQLEAIGPGRGGDHVLELLPGG